MEAKTDLIEENALRDKEIRMIEEEEKREIESMRKRRFGKGADILNEEE